MIYTQGGAFFELSWSSKDIRDSGAITLENIAHGISNLCRFHGQTREFYSVAQHSVIMAQEAGTRRLALLALFHDAAEAFTGDVISIIKKPVNHKTNGLIKKYEDKIDKAIFDIFRIPPKTPNEGKQVKLLDRQALITEARDLMPAGAAGALQGQFKHCILPFTRRIKPLPPQDAKNLFLEAYRRAVEIRLVA